MAELNDTEPLKGDAKGREQFLLFMRNLDNGHKGAKISPLIRSIRGRFENALPHIENEAARLERERILRAIREQGNNPALTKGRRDVLRAVADDIEMGLI